MSDESSVMDLIMRAVEGADGRVDQQKLAARAKGGLLWLPTAVKVDIDKITEGVSISGADFLVLLENMSRSGLADVYCDGREICYYPIVAVYNGLQTYLLDWIKNVDYKSDRKTLLAIIQSIRAFCDTYRELGFPDLQDKGQMELFKQEVGPEVDITKVRRIRKKSDSLANPKANTKPTTDRR